MKSWLVVGMGWDGMGWDGMGWDGMGREKGMDAVRTTVRRRRRLHVRLLQATHMCGACLTFGTQLQFTKTKSASR